jgi:hypothetical protein
LFTINNNKMSVIINHSGTSEYFEVNHKICFQLEAKLNASRYVDRWSDLGDKLYQAGSGNLDLISIPEHQYLFLKTALTTPHPRPEEVKPLRKVAFDGIDILVSRKPVVVIPFMTMDKSIKPKITIPFMTIE